MKSLASSPSISPSFGIFNLCKVSIVSDILICEVHHAFPRWSAMASRAPRLSCFCLPKRTHSANTTRLRVSNYIAVGKSLAFYRRHMRHLLRANKKQTEHRRVYLHRARKSYPKYRERINFSATPVACSDLFNVIATPPIFFFFFTFPLRKF